MEINIEPGTLTVTVASAIVFVGAAVWAGVKYFTKRNFDHYFEKNLERHKSDLQNILELNKFDLQRKMHDFSLYTTKKHEIYPKLYQLFLLADGRLGELRGFQSKYDFKTLNAEQIIYILKTEYEIPEVSYQKYLTDWDARKESFIDDFIDFMRRVEFQRANRAIIEAKNNALLYDLYLSNEVSEKLLKLSGLLRSYLVDAEHVKDFIGPERTALAQEMAHTEEEITKLILEIKSIMQSELKKGYYVTNEKHT